MIRACLTFHIIKLTAKLRGGRGAPTNRTDDCSPLSAKTEWHAAGGWVARRRRGSPFLFIRCFLAIFLGKKNFCEGERGQSMCFFMKRSFNNGRMSAGSNGMSGGDLGFIANQPYKGPSSNRFFFGSPGNPSKKGVQPKFGPLSKANLPNDSSAEVGRSDMTEDGLVNKRTEWLEGQERKLTATMNEQRGNQQRLAEQMASSLGTLESVSKETTRLRSEQSRIAHHTRQLYNEQQWVYGHTSCKLLGIDGCDKHHQTLSEYRKNKAAHALIVVSPAKRWVLMSYPMERVDTDHGYQFLMKVKTVDPKTGQLSIDWAIVYEQTDGKEVRPIDEFALSPSH